MLFFCRYETYKLEKNRREIIIVARTVTLKFVLGESNVPGRAIYFYFYLFIFFYNKHFGRNRNAQKYVSQKNMIVASNRVIESWTWESL